MESRIIPMAIFLYLAITTTRAQTGNSMDETIGNLVANANAMQNSMGKNPPKPKGGSANPPFSLPSFPMVLYNATSGPHPPPSGAPQSMSSSPPANAQNQTDYWKQQFGQNAKVPKAIQDSMSKGSGSPEKSKTKKSAAGTPSPTKKSATGASESTAKSATKKSTAGTSTSSVKSAAKTSASAAKSATKKSSAPKTSTEKSATKKSAAGTHESTGKSAAKKSTAKKIHLLVHTGEMTTTRSSSSRSSSSSSSSISSMRSAASSSSSVSHHIASKKGHAHVQVGPNHGVKVRAHKGAGHGNVDVNPFDGVGVDAGGKKGFGNVKVNPMNGVNVNAGSKEHPVYVGVKPDINPFQYQYDKKGQNPAARALFFLEKDMRPGHTMKLHLAKTTNEATFLPKDKADSLPFSSDQLPSILQEFSMEPDSEQAKVVEETIKGCEHTAIRGEDKYCATSLESLIDYAKNTFGKNVRAMSTELEDIVDKIENYTISAIRKVTKDKEPAVCHKQNYAYAVFYCHKTKGTSAYMLSLMSSHGSKAKSVAICHKDTSAWNPEHLAFDVLRVKPGTTPICHVLPEDHIVWVPY